MQLLTRGVKLISTEGHISIMASLKGPVATELITIIYAMLILNQRLCDVIMVLVQ